MNFQNTFQQPERMASWKVICTFGVVCFIFAFGLRCLDFPKWSNPQFMVDGEYIMGTHDAYYWLAGAKGVGSAVANPMAHLLKLLGVVISAPYGNIAFWLPAVFAGLTSIAAFAWGTLIGGTWVGIVAAFYATSIPSYFYRTRLAYYDTDIITLLFPLLISFLLARWLAPCIQKSWAEKRGECDYSFSVIEYSLPFIAGCLTNYGSCWHGDILSFGMISFLVVSGMVIFLASGSNRIKLIQGLIVYATAAFWGLSGAIVGMILLVAFQSDLSRKNRAISNRCVLVVALIAIFVGGAGDSLYAVITSKIGAYIKPVVEGVAIKGLVYPGITQSVIEAQDIEISALMNLLTGNVAISCLGFVGFLAVLLFRPASLLLIPFLLATLASVKLGGRFAMFGGVIIGVGISFLFYLLINICLTDTVLKRILVAVQSVACIVLLSVFILPDYLSAPATPIMFSGHVKALKEIKRLTNSKSTFWTWWDWGYATSYYTGSNVFANGGNHGGKILYPLSLAYTTPSFMQANQLIKFCAANNNNPSTVIDKMGAENAKKFLISLGIKKYKFPTDGKQYIVVTWNNIRLAYWILYYGTWDLKNGGGGHPSVSQIYNSFNLDSNEGILSLVGGRKIPLSGVSVLDKKHSFAKEYDSLSGAYLVYNKMLNVGFTVDNLTYRSMLFRLLVEDPSSEQVSRFFKLVYDGFPMVRIYEVK